ncbi:hypothetical protein D0Y53_11260 [Luteimonas weifangensis]|uniref:Uncharacterized protein n=2 Tax=Cognatiluteimonas weifangensis TaxID=2303539 RepID=A0A372DII0_9GAMM|nr:hypothetical protein D0Y53_11260 [Luteimonas weifangensis]
MTNFMRNLIHRFRNVVRPRFRIIEVEDDFPEMMESRALYVLSEDGDTWAAAMVCPCGCRTVLHLNLIADQRPCWYLNRQGGGSLTPSVWRRDNCGAHFWFRGGRVYWTPDQPHTLMRDLRLWRG